MEHYVYNLQANVVIVGNKIPKIIIKVSTVSNTNAVGFLVKAYV